MEIFAIPDQSAETCADVIINEVITRYGCPLTVHSDQGRNFEARIFEDMCTLLQLHKTRTTPGNPRCNGLVERFNRTLVWMIKSYLRGEQQDWDKHLGCLAGAYRQTRHQSTKFSPNRIMLGREVHSPTEIRFGLHTHESYLTYGAHVLELQEKLQHACDLARKLLRGAAQQQKAIYDTKVHAHLHQLGQLV